MPPRFSPALLARIYKEGRLRIRAGRGAHDFLSIWAVVVDDRVFVRSWNDAPTGWYRAWRADPAGAILVGARAIAARARPVRGERLLDRISDAYLEKYRRPGSRGYAKGMNTLKRRRATLELLPSRRTA